MTASLRSIGPALVTAAAALASLSAQTSMLNTLTPADEQAGWKLLFDGKAIDKWRAYKTISVPDNWTIEDNAITLTNTRRAIDLISVDEFGDFDFRFDWKLWPAPPAGNSGVMYYVNELSSETYHTGPEYQVLDNANHADGKNPLTTSASCYAIYAPARDVTKPVGEWNSGRIVINKGKVEHWLNGEKVLEYDLNSADFKAKVAASKFKEWPGYAMARRGHLALQQHLAKVAFRNLKIKTLD